ncbi:MAG: hypothetical protein ACRD4X_03650 [Candidatus Acidiferrales bacterium]
MVIVRGSLANSFQAVRLMTRFKSLPVAIAIALFTFPAVAQQSGKMADTKEAPAKEIVGAVQSFSGNILDIKPPTVAPAVWVTIPANMKVDRAALKPGVQVSVEARWATVTYIALKPPKIMPSKKHTAE